MRIIETIRTANRPGPPEHSIALRVACLGAVIVAIAASASMGEISGGTALCGIGLAALGMGFSYATRSHPPAWTKVLVAAGAIGVSVWFFQAVTGPVDGIANVEEPLIVLLVSILVLHSFHVPSRRDLTFSLAAAAGLMAVGGAQALDLRFGLYALAWAGFSLAGLTLMWRSASGGGRMSVALLVSVLSAVGAAAFTIFLVLPAPTVAAKLNLFDKAGVGGSVGIPGALAGDAGSPSQLARPGSPTGPTRVGGYLGFANSLDTALRGKLDNTLLMLVRAERPSYWVGETFNSWNGESWASTNSSSHVVFETSPFLLPPETGSSALAQSDLQTFYVVGSTANLVFHAEAASELWFPTSKIYVSSNGAIVSPIGLGKGAIYSVESQVVAATPQQLQGDSSKARLPVALAESYLQLPYAYPRAQALAESITAGDHTTYARVESLIAWMGTHTRYSLDIPPLPPGADTVNEFLFGNRVGFCEQISTSLAVMLRSIGIPTARSRRLRPGLVQPCDRLVRGTRRRCARVGAGVVSGPWLAELRSDRGRPAGQPLPGHDRPARPRRSGGTDPVLTRLRCGPRRGISRSAAPLAPLPAQDVDRKNYPERRTGGTTRRPSPVAGSDPHRICRCPRRDIGDRIEGVEPAGLAGGGKRLRGLRDFTRHATKDGGPGETATKKAWRPPRKLEGRDYLLLFLRPSPRRAFAGTCGTGATGRGSSDPIGITCCVAVDDRSIFFKRSFVRWRDPSSSTIARPITTKG